MKPNWIAPLHLTKIKQYMILMLCFNVLPAFSPARTHGGRSSDIHNPLFPIICISLPRDLPENVPFLFVNLLCVGFRGQFDNITTHVYTAYGTFMVLFCISPACFPHELFRKRYPLMRGPHWLHCAMHCLSWVDGPWAGFRRQILSRLSSVF